MALKKLLDSSYFPSKKETFGQKCLDGVKYIGKNSWKVLPIGSLINWKISQKNKSNALKEFGGDILHSFYIAGIALYFVAGISLGVWTPSQYKLLSKNLQSEYDKIHQINEKTRADYNALFKDAKNFGDSLAVYQHYCLPIKLEEPTFDEKETAVKINKLEKSLK